MGNMGPDCSALLLVTVDTVSQRGKLMIREADGDEVAELRLPP